jgi:hypothetical protein
MRGTYFQWTPKAITRLRELVGTMRRQDIADQLGCTQSAVASEMHKLKISVRETDRKLAVRGYMERYKVSRSMVEKIGVDRLNRMSEEGRELFLHSRLGRHNAARHKDSSNGRKLSKAERTERIERMMQLAERCA